MSETMPSLTRYAVDITGSPRRFFDIDELALTYAAERIYTSPETRRAALRTLRGETGGKPRPFSYAYGFADVTIYPPQNEIEAWVAKDMSLALSVIRTLVAEWDAREAEAVAKGGRGRPDSGVILLARALIDKHGVTS